MIDDRDRRDATALLDFWFGAPGTPEHDLRRKMWFTVDPAFDAELATRFGALERRAAKGELAHWQAERDLGLALVLLLDQLPRNLYRGKAQAFASDALARDAADAAMARGFDRALPPVRRQFLYLPFEHSERLADQQRSVALFEMLGGETGDASFGRWARQHHDIIERFGRFPHRNAALGRATTQEEAAFLAGPNSSF